MGRRATDTPPVALGSGPGTPEHFRAWAADLVLDSGESWDVEDWQLKVVGDVLAGRPIVWAIIPEGNGKTTLMAGVALYHLDPAGWGVRRPRVVIAAASAKQAKWLYDQAELFVASNRRLRETFRCLGGFKEIRVAADELAKLEVFAQDDRTADGAIFTLAIVDELHNHRDLRLYRRWVGKLWKRDGQIAVISTAGDPASEFEEARARLVRRAKVVRDGSHTRAESEDAVLHDWALEDRALCEDMEAVARANPLAALTPEILRRKRADPTLSLEHWLRFTCNLPTRIAGQGINPEDWEALREEGLQPRSGIPFYGGVDLGWRQDCTALVLVGWEAPERRLVAAAKIFAPPVDEADVVRGLVYLQREFNPVGWAYDPNASGRQMMQMLEKGAHPAQADVRFEFHEHSQMNAPMALAAARLDEAIRARWLVHDGDDELRKHVLAAVKRPTSGEQFRFDRPPEARQDRSRWPIDGLTALLMAHSYAVGENERPAVPLVALR